MNGRADNYNPEATSDDESCIISGCLDEAAANYNEFANTDNGFCLIPGCVVSSAENFNPAAGINDGSCIIFGCTLESYPNYNLFATIDDNSCDMNSAEIHGCTDPSSPNFDSNATTNNGRYCEMYRVGDIVGGGIVFYVDETFEHGLMAAIEDIGSYQFGCLDGVSAGYHIGAGFQNSLNMVTENCQTYLESGITSAQAALSYDGGGYSDWFLPSRDELIEMYNTIGNGGPQGNIGSFTNQIYASSSNGCYPYQCSATNFGNGSTTCFHYKHHFSFVERSFSVIFSIEPKP